jgi:hypothetical protein
MYAPICHPARSRRIPAPEELSHANIPRAVGFCDNLSVMQNDTQCTRPRVILRVVAGSRRQRNFRTRTYSGLWDSRNKSEEDSVSRKMTHSMYEEFVPSLGGGMEVRPCYLLTNKE